MERLKYTVLRFCPDEVKQEVFNVGVVVQDLSTGKIAFETVERDDTRLQHNLTDAQLYSFRKFAIELRKHFRLVSGTLVDERVGVSTKDDGYLERLSEVLSYGFQTGSIRPAVAPDIDSFVDRVFASHITISKTREPDVTRQLYSKFSESGIAHKITKNAQIAGAAIPLTAAFGYQNGKPNYIQPISLQQNPKENLKDGAFWSEVVREVRTTESAFMFHFVVRQGNRTHSASAEKVKELIESSGPVRLYDFDTQVPNLVQAVTSDLADTAESRHLH